MGQQQLFLIILGVIIVGIAIAVGLSLFTAQSIQSSRDAIINYLDNLRTGRLCRVKMAVLEVEALFQTVGDLLSRSRGSSGHLVSHSEFLGAATGE